MPDPKIPKRKKPTPTQLKKGLDVLAKILWRQRWHDQGGFPGLRNGEWDFMATSLDAGKDELTPLFAAVGIVPDEIVPIGSCGKCAHAVKAPAGHYHERGYAEPCRSCKRPKMSNFVPRESLTKKKKTK